MSFIIKLLTVLHDELTVVGCRFLQHVAAHPLIRRDETFKSFLQTETKVPKAKGSGIANMMAKLVGYNEGDEVRTGWLFGGGSCQLMVGWQWFADKGGELDALEGQLKKLHNTLET